MGDEPEVVDVAVGDEVPEGLRVGLEGVFGREVERAVEFVVELGGPDLGDRLLSVRRVLVGSDGDRPHRRDLDDRDGNGLLHSLTRRVRLVVDHDDVGHAGLVAGEALGSRCSVVVWPRANAWDL